MIQKYVLRAYNPHFPKFYKREKVKLKKILTKDAKIEHIGSSAVIGLSGKGIIDIIISVAKKDIEKTKKKLQEKGYKFKPLAGDKERLFLEKDYKYLGKIRRVHIHLTRHNSPIWKKCIAVRDYLRNNPKEAEEYIKIKKKAIKIAREEGKIYRSYKKSFLDKLEEKALKS